MAAIYSGSCISFYFAMLKSQAWPGEARKMCLPSFLPAFPFQWWMPHEQTETVEMGMVGKENEMSLFDVEKGRGPL